MSERIFTKETSTGGNLVIEKLQNGYFLVGIRWADYVYEWAEEFETLPLALMRFALLLELEESQGTFTDNAETFTRYAQGFLTQMGSK